MALFHLLISIFCINIATCMIVLNKGIFIIILCFLLSAFFGIISAAEYTNDINSIRLLIKNKDAADSSGNNKEE